MLNRFTLAISMILITSGLGFIASRAFIGKNSLLSPVLNEIKNDLRPFDKYSIDDLKKTEFKTKDFIISEQISDLPNLTSSLFFLKDNESSVSGLINIPKSDNPQGIIILLRGFVDKSVFTSGTGTKRIGERLASNGFVTLAPDFLGYGRSSSPSAFPMEERFQTYTTVLSLLDSWPNIVNALKEQNPVVSVDELSQNIGIFGHSNGGHIALAALEISGANYPTVLWAPVSKPFPFSILFFTDEYDDKGKALRKLIADFEKDYDVEKYSVDNYFDYIKAPLSIHQGLADIEVPYWWSDDLTASLESKDKEFEYFKYPGEDHNFNQGSFETLATRTVNFYIQKFNKK